MQLPVKLTILQPIHATAGGSSGIGLGLAEEFLKAGSTVIITGRRESALKEAEDKFPSLHYHVSDSASAEDREQLAGWAVNNFPKLNILVGLAPQYHFCSSLSPSCNLPVIMAKATARCR